MNPDHELFENTEDNPRECQFFELETEDHYMDACTYYITKDNKGFVKCPFFTNTSITSISSRWLMARSFCTFYKPKTTQYAIFAKITRPCPLTRTRAKEFNPEHPTRIESCTALIQISKPFSNKKSAEMRKSSSWMLEDNLIVLELEQNQNEKS